jgi:hypothetical protein
MTSRILRNAPHGEGSKETKISRKDYYKKIYIFKLPRMKFKHYDYNYGDYDDEQIVPIDGNIANVILTGIQAKHNIARAIEIKDKETCDKIYLAVTKLNSKAGGTYHYLIVFDVDVKKRFEQMKYKEDDIDSVEELIEYGESLLKEKKEKAKEASKKRKERERKKQAAKEKAEKELLEKLEKKIQIR